MNACSILSHCLIVLLLYLSKSFLTLSCSPSIASDFLESKVSHESPRSVRDNRSKINMRLNDPTYTDVDQMTGQKRARPTFSSLDVLTEDGHKKTTPNKPGDGLDEKLEREAMLQALYDDPQFAERTQSTKERRNKEGGAKSNSAFQDKAYPHHLKAMMEDGVPVKQWIILLFLIGAGVYQLRKALVGPTVLATAVPQKGGKISTKRKAKTKKGGKNNNRAAKAVTSVSQNTALLEDEIDWEDEEGAKKPHTSPKNVTFHARNKNTNKPVAPAPKLTSDSPDSISTDGSSSTDGRDSPPTIIDTPQNNIQAVESLPFPENGTAANHDGWQTVNKDKIETLDLTDLVEPTQIVSLTKPQNEIEEPAPFDLSNDAIGADTLHVTQSPVQAVKQRKSKVKKAKKQVVDEKTTNVVVKTKEINAISDEDLALMLHLEEERIAQFEKDRASKEDIWEDVVVTKRKNKAVDA